MDLAFTLLFFLLLFSLVGYLSGKFFGQKAIRLTGIIGGIVFLLSSVLSLMFIEIGKLDNPEANLGLTDLVKSLVTGITVGVFFLIGTAPGLYFGLRFKTKT